MGGYIGRLALVVLAIVAVKDASWVEHAPFYGTILLTHVGLLVWETRSISASLAYPGLKPRLVPSKEAPTP
jgi:hypothetical protein